jgi:hypothetical protein
MQRSDEEKLSVALLVAYSAVVERNVASGQELAVVFGELREAAMTADEQVKERSIIKNRLEVESLMRAMASDPARFRSHIDRTMRIVLDLPADFGEVSWTKWIQRYIAKLLLLFMQGITIFQARDDGDTIGTPAYHRASSCGPWSRGAVRSSQGVSQAFERDHLVCDASTMSPEEIERRRRNIWTCLVERMVYDRLYRYFIGEQDIGHLHNEQRVTRDLFERCFAASQISVAALQVSMDRFEEMPVSMTIWYQTPGHRVKDSFYRTITGRRYRVDVNKDEEDVNATREVRPAANAAGGPVEVSERTQSYFREPGEWLPVSPGAPPIAGGRGGSKRRAMFPGAPDPWRGKFGIIHQ